MHLKKVAIRNFRAIERIEIEFSEGLNVIVGPNAIGKTTIIEAIRLSKALLAPRSPQEQTQVLHSLGASSPHIPQRIFMDVLARDAKHPITIVTSYSLHKDEIDFFRDNIKQIATTIVQNQLGQFFGSPAALIQHLSSNEGQEQLAQAEQAVIDATSTFSQNHGCEQTLTIDPISQRISGTDAINQLLLAILDQRLPPYQSLFSYFPADRAFPAGEQLIQIGSQDTPQQIESHNSQPQLKFSRLKHSLVTSIIQDPESAKALETDFQQIFESLLAGRSFVSIGIRPELGLVSIKVRDDSTGTIFDLDGMSSGEKAVIMTFFLIARSVANHGIVLFDEPELHLNPAVCRNILPFMAARYVGPKHIQALLCTHSAELMSSALDMPDCALLHLRSSSLITPVRPKDTDEVAAALNLLGASELDNLMYRGLLFVEGDDDVQILQLGFPDQLARLKVRQLGGRREIEKHVAQLQDAEARGADLVRTSIIFDHDGQPTSLKSSDQVKLTQWDRYCIENYLIDADVLVDLLKITEFATNPLKNLGEAQNLLKKLALSQVNTLAAKLSYSSFDYPSIGARLNDLNSANIETIADRLYERVFQATAALERTDLTTWKTKFIAQAESRAADLLDDWSGDWVVKCNGKQLFMDLQRTVGIKMPLRKFKKAVIQEMRARKSPGYTEMERILNLLLTP